MTIDADSQQTINRGESRMKFGLRIEKGKRQVILFQFLWKDDDTHRTIQTVREEINTAPRMRAFHPFENEIRHAVDEQYHRVVIREARLLVALDPEAAQMLKEKGYPIYAKRRLVTIN